MVRPPINIFATNFLLVVLLVAQVSVQPFQGKWRNFVDALFLCSLVLLFLGSIFFWSEYSGANENYRNLIIRYGLAYSTIFIILGFLLMATIFTYHIIVRFPKVHNRLNYVIQRFRGTNASTSLTTHGEQAKKTLSSENFNNGNKCSIATFSEIREPLLEAGSVDIYNIDPSTKIEQHNK